MKQQPTLTESRLETTSHSSAVGIFLIALSFITLLCIVVAKSDINWSLKQSHRSLHAQVSPDFVGPVLPDDESDTASNDSDDSSNGLAQSSSFATQHPAEMVNHAVREQILSDYKDRVSTAFKVPEKLNPRVGFWFDIYTKYGYHQRVIHHSRHPWLIYRVVDVASILNSQEPRARWLREERANKYAANELREVRMLLLSLAKKSPLATFNDSEKKISEQFKTLPGNYKANLRYALEELRVQTGQKDFFADGLEIGSKYLPHMEQIFVRAGLPGELTRLPLVESSFNRNATSSAGAVGIWQFMQGTGRKYMKVDAQVDERRSPLKSTAAAAKLLKENHMILYRSWPLAISAYNHGPGGIRKAVKKYGSTDIATLANEHQTANFDFASQNYYAEFLAALHAEKYSELIWKNLRREEILQISEVSLKQAIRPKDLLKKLEMTPEDLLYFNADISQAIKTNSSLPAGFRLSLPKDVDFDMFGRLAQGNSPAATNKRSSRKTNI
jgi:membrane-bound lytic murein transglycosylase D